MVVITKRLVIIFLLLSLGTMFLSGCTRSDIRTFNRFFTPDAEYVGKWTETRENGVNRMEITRNGWSFSGKKFLVKKFTNTTDQGQQYSATVNRRGNLSAERLGEIEHRGINNHLYCEGINYKRDK